MADPLSVVLFFTGPSGLGWSERFWINPTLTGDAQTGEVQSLINNRAGILTNTCFILRARIQTSQLRNPRIYIPPGTGGLPGTETPPTAENEVALLALAQAPAIGYARPFLRGIPSRIVNGDDYNPDDTFKNNFDQLSQVLIDGNWFVNGNLGSDPTQTMVKTIAPTTPRGYNFQIVPPAVVPPGFGKGTVIRMHGCSVPGYNGLKVVTDVQAPMAPATATTVTVGGAAPPVNDNGVSPFFTVEKLSNGVIASFVALRISRRGAGRPFGQPRGRRPTLYSLRR